MKIKDLVYINKNNYNQKKDKWQFINYLDTANLTENKIDNIQRLIVGKDKIPSRAKRKVQKYDILYSTVRPNQKHYGFIESPLENMLVSTGFAVLTPKPSVVPYYLYLYLTQESITNELHSIAEGNTSAYPSIKPSELGEIEINFPKIDIQKKISDLIKSLDKKIELNNQINEKLEETAKALYKEWFVNFNFPDENGLPYKDNGGEFVDSELGKIPVGWNVGKLDDIIIDITSGVSTKVKSELSDDIYKYPVIGASRTMAYSNDYNIDSKVLIIGRVGTLGVVQRINEKVWATDNTLIVNTSYYEYVYNILKTLDYKSLNRGSTQPLITRSDIRNTKIIIPNEQILTIFENLLLPFSNQLENCIKETKVLDKIKNILLSKLMSGQIDVDKLNIDWDKLDKTLKEVENLV